MKDIFNTAEIVPILEFYDSDYDISNKGKSIKRYHIGTILGNGEESCICGDITSDRIRDAILKINEATGV